MEACVDDEVEARWWGGSLNLCSWSDIDLVVEMDGCLIVDSSVISLGTQ